MRILRIVFAPLIFIGIQGCATITKGTTDTIQVQIANCSEAISCSASNKKGSWSFQAPGPVTFKKSDNDLVISCKDGNGMLTQRITPTRGSMAWGNAVFGGVIGGGVDASTDAHWNIVDSITLHRNSCFGQDVRTQPSIATATSQGVTSPTPQTVSMPAGGSSGGAQSTVSTSTGIFDRCKSPLTPSSIPAEAGHSELLSSRRELEKFQAENTDYQQCLADGMAQPATAEEKQDAMTAHNMSVTIEEALVNEFNAAYDRWEASR